MSKKLISFQKPIFNFCYHKKIGFPKTLLFFDFLARLSYTKHAIDRRDKKYKGEKIFLPTAIKIKKSNTIAVHTNDNTMPEILIVRKQYNKKQDMILVIEPVIEKNLAVVITFYLNAKNDLHKTLDKSKYTKPL